MDSATLNAVRRKCHVTWTDDDAENGTNARLRDVVATVSPRLSSLVGYPSDHAYTSADDPAWGLFLNGCLYEFSDAWDDFEKNYATEILSTRLLILGGSDDAQAQG